MELKAKAVVDQIASQLEGIRQQTYKTELMLKHLHFDKEKTMQAALQLIEDEYLNIEDNIRGYLTTLAFKKSELQA